MTNREDNYLNKHVLFIMSRPNNDHELWIRGYRYTPVVIQESLDTITYHLELARKINEISNDK